MLEARQKLQSAATTGNGTEVDLKGECSAVSFYIKGSSGVSAGAVTLESASVSGYAGTWAPIGSPVTVIADTEQMVSVAGVCYLIVRARISTTVADGTVTVEMIAQSGAGA